MELTKEEFAEFFTDDDLDRLANMTPEEAHMMGYFSCNEKTEQEKQQEKTEQKKQKTEQKEKEEDDTEKKEEFVVRFGVNGDVIATYDTALSAYEHQKNIFFHSLELTQGCFNVKEMLERSHRYMREAYERLSEDEKLDRILPANPNEKKFVIRCGKQGTVSGTCDTALEAYLGQEKTYRVILETTIGCGERMQPDRDIHYQYLCEAHALLTEEEKRNYVLPPSRKCVDDGMYGIKSGLASSLSEASKNGDCIIA